jgi:hypothetical protein
VTGDPSITRIKKNSNMQAWIDEVQEAPVNPPQLPKNTEKIPNGGASDAVCAAGTWLPSPPCCCTCSSCSSLNPCSWCRLQQST